MALSNSTITQSALFGSNRDDAFNDIVSVGGWPMTQNIKKISKIELHYGGVIDNITVTYEIAGSSSPSIQSHGGTHGGLTNAIITLNGDEYLVGVSGQYGRTLPEYGTTNIMNLQFVILDKAKGIARLEPPTGSFAEHAQQPGTPFSVTGTVLALAGYAQTPTTRTYLQSLSFFNASTGFD